MSARIIDGKRETEAILAEVGEGVRRLAEAGKRATLAAVQANRDPGSDWYVQAQARHAAAQGVEHRLVRLSPDASQAELLAAVRRTAADPEVSGVIILTPLPPGADQSALAEALPPAKDAEGAHPANLGRLLISGSADPLPCTAAAALALIKSALPDLSGRRALVIGRSATVGKPLALLLLAAHATVTVAHSRSDLAEALPGAEVVAAAAGASGARWRAYEAEWLAWRAQRGERPAPPDLAPLVQARLVRRGAVVIDVGDNQIPAGLDSDGAPLPDAAGKPDFRYAGDVDFAGVSEVAGCLNRPRGGVGPLTNAFLLRNVVRAALAAQGLPLSGGGA